MDTSIELLRDHNVKQEEIFTFIRKGLKEYVKTYPKQRILYNSIHGGYDLSKEFVDFCKNYKAEIKSDIDVRNSHRISYVPYIIPFAKHILKNKQYDGLFEIMYLHNYYNLSSIFRLIYLYNCKVESRENLLKNAETARKYLSNDKSIFFDKTNQKKCKDFYYYKPSLIGFQMQKVDLERYTREDIEYFLNTQYTDDTPKVENNEKEVYNDSSENDSSSESDSDDDLDNYQDPNTLSSSLIFIDKMIAKYKTKILNNIPENIMNEIIIYKDTYKTNDEPVDYYYHEKERQILVLLKKYGYGSNNTWRKQNKFDHVAMSFLAEKQKQNIQPSTKTTIYDFLVNNTYIDIDQITQDTVLEDFGLLCASSKYCELDIAEIPGLLDWSIGEYDGKENICIV